MKGYIVAVIITVFCIGVPLWYVKRGHPEYKVSKLEWDYKKVLKEFEGKEEIWKPDEAMVKRGVHLYENMCATCHGRNGDSLPVTPEGLKTDLGDPIYARDFTGKYHKDGKVVFKFGSGFMGELASDEDLKSIIKEGLQGTPMPGYPNLSERDLKAIIEYIKTLNPKWRFVKVESRYYPEPPDDLMTPERVEKGREVFRSFCIACHRNPEAGEEPLVQPSFWYEFDKDGNLKFENGAPSFQAVRSRWFGKEPLRRPKPDYIFVTIRDGIGGTTMTPWAHLGDETIWNLVAYILHLQKEGGTIKNASR